MDTLIAFDFDGTLYPFAPYDSEELLMLLASRSRGELIRARAKRAVAKDIAGKSSLEVFDRDYLRYAKGATMQTIREVVDFISRPCQAEWYAPLKELSAKADLIVLSAGTTEIARMFLQRFGVENLFTGFYGKHLIFSPEGKMTGYTSEVPTTRAKAEVLHGLGSRYQRVFATGDGLTDRFMLAEADVGIQLRYNGKRLFDEYPMTRSLPETVALMLTRL